MVKSPTPPAGHAPPPILRERSMSTLPPPSETLRGIVKYSPYILKQGMQTLQSCISSGMGILEACKVAGTSMGFSDKLFGGGPKEVYADFFGILTSVEDATKRELESG